MDKLKKEANKAMERAYAPYSNFKVGAALETEDGKIYTGCNVENSSFGLTICAERTAFCKAISEGETKFKRIYIVADTENPVPPCGMCRQTMAEFNPELEIVMSNVDGDEKTILLKEIFPEIFKLKR